MFAEDAAPTSAPEEQYKVDELRSRLEMMWAASASDSGSQRAPSSTGAPEDSPRASDGGGAGGGGRAAARRKRVTFSPDVLVWDGKPGSLAGSLPHEAEALMGAALAAAKAAAALSQQEQQQQPAAEAAGAGGSASGKAAHGLRQKLHNLWAAHGHGHGHGHGRAHPGGGRGAAAHEAGPQQGAEPEQQGEPTPDADRKVARLRTHLEGLWAAAHHGHHAPKHTAAEPAAAAKAAPQPALEAAHAAAPAPAAAPAGSPRECFGLNFERGSCDSEASSTSADAAVLITQPPPAPAGGGGAGSAKALGSAGSAWPLAGNPAAVKNLARPLGRRQAPLLP